MRDVDYGRAGCTHGDKYWITEPQWTEEILEEIPDRFLQLPAGELNLFSVPYLSYEDPFLLDNPRIIVLHPTNHKRRFSIPRRMTSQCRRADSTLGRRTLRKP